METVFILKSKSKDWRNQPHKVSVSPLFRLESSPDICNVTFEKP